MIDDKPDFFGNPEPTEAELKLRAKPHGVKKSSVTAYEVSNYFGAVCGGNLMAFIAYSNMSDIDYPTVFWHSEAIQCARLLNAANPYPTDNPMLSRLY